MYAGRIVETAPVHALFASPQHPYTRGLLAARPQMGAQRTPTARLATIAGTVPELVDLPTGCTFAGRCAFTAQACHGTRPQATVVAHDADGVHEVRCLRPEAMQAASHTAQTTQAAA